MRYTKTDGAHVLNFRHKALVIENTLFLDTSKFTCVRYEPYKEWIPSLLMGNHYSGDGCWCSPVVHQGFEATVIHKNPGLLAERALG